VAVTAIDTTLPTLLTSAADSIALHLVAENEYASWFAQRSEAVQTWLQRNAFKAERARWILIPAEQGSTPRMLAGIGNRPPDAQGWLWLGAALADRLPSGIYHVAGEPPPAAFVQGWALGSYRFMRYRRQNTPPSAQLVCTQPPLDWPAIAATTRAAALARDLINTPANDMGPAELEGAAQQLAARMNGTLTVTSGAALREGFPLIAAVGQGSPRAPRLLDLRFSRPGAPKVTLVGKGVCFDTGGLDMKPSAGMALMKKDMGGAAHVLAAAQLLRELDLPVDLRVLIPAVENSVDGGSLRPGDVLRSRKGLAVEITNTDAEGRLVLADALAYAGEEKPDLLIDFATLTGAARVALGPELPPIYSGDAGLLNELMALGRAEGDPLWPMPLWDPYDDELSSRIADLNNAPAGGMAGSITAALFLRRFVTDAARWLHLDIYAWNPKDRPGRPQGAEAQGLRAVAAWLRSRYGATPSA
jgi:leucyl aminopeptidase